MFVWLAYIDGDDFCPHQTNIVAYIDGDEFCADRRRRGELLEDLASAMLELVPDAVAHLISTGMVKMVAEHQRPPTPAATSERRRRWGRRPRQEEEVTGGHRRRSRGPAATGGAWGRPPEVRRGPARVEEEVTGGLRSPVEEEVSPAASGGEGGARRCRAREQGADTGEGGVEVGEICKKDPKFCRKAQFRP
ncbi:hypothetical protein BRADI_2g13986v3 [Brachypodium distachyon]|uniref:Uncharacterized protein n=1 Tax=Brachypodium distachyon TaxID=15368 RepID=A0A2K2D8I9_BRADI|nr:hypothetical protein BRADI_2g13986v3 [Brachypodium distachyon]